MRKAGARPPLGISHGGAARGGEPEVTLYVRARSSDGRDKFPAPVWNRSRTLRAGYAMIAGQAEYHPEAVYYLRYLKLGKRVWQNVGPEPDDALVAFVTSSTSRL